jgi:hypothetical protein
MRIESSRTISRVNVELKTDVSDISLVFYFVRYLAQDREQHIRSNNG